MDDPLVPKRLEDAITMVGTCLDMCPRFERYRRERENNLTEFETIPGTKRVDHKRAVKIYERAAGDKTLPSDLRPPHVLKKTLDYLFHQLMPERGFGTTYTFIRDRSRAVRNDFTMQHETGLLAMECHARCARFHILALHLERDTTNFSVALEEQQLMNTLQSLKEFYTDQRNTYQSPTELEMRVYHRLIHIRDQIERPEPVPLPDAIASHPVYTLVTRFRKHVQARSAPISKTSKLVVGPEGMQIFGVLAATLQATGARGMVYLVACILERLFGKETVDNIEAIRGDMTLPDVIDGVDTGVEEVGVQEDGGSAGATTEGEGDERMDGFLTEEEMDGDGDDEGDGTRDHAAIGTKSAEIVQRRGSEWLKNTFGVKPTQSAVIGSSSASTSTAKPKRSLADAPALGADASVLTATVSEPLPAPAPTSAATGSAFTSFSPTPSAFASSGTSGSAFGGSAFGKGTSNAFGGSTFSVFSGDGGNNGSQGSGSIFGTQKPVSSSGPGGAAAAHTTTVTSTGFGGVTASSAKQEATLNAFAQPFTPSGAAKAGPATSKSAQNGAVSATAPASTAPFSFDAQSATQMLPPPQPPQRNMLAPSHPQAQAQSQSHARLPPPIQTTGLGLNLSQPLPTPLQMPSTPPSAPPPLGRQHLLSLPPTPSASTPTTTSYFGSFQTPPTGASSTPAAAASNGLTRTPTEPLLDGPATTGSGERGRIPKSIFGTLGRLQTSGGAGGAGDSVLSPLVLGSPGVSRMPSFFESSPGNGNAVAPGLGPLRQSSLPFAAGFAGGDDMLTSSFSLKGKGKERENQTAFGAEAIKTEQENAMQLAVSDEETRAKEKADAFRFKGVVGPCWRRWKDRSARVRVWEEACRASDAYSEKVGRERVKGRAGASPDRKRKPSVSMSVSTGSVDGSVDGSPVRKRLKNRLSGSFKPPVGDEEMARRLELNQEEQERRWARGSFLGLLSLAFERAGSIPSANGLSNSISGRSMNGLSNSISSLSTSVNGHKASNLAPAGVSPYSCAWLSLNPENDGTAIWLEQKFGVPEAGRWRNTNVFQLHVEAPSSSSSSSSAPAPTIAQEFMYPAMIVFERTPAGDSSDPLELKYRTLDDCARLREIIGALPSERHFVPTLLSISWTGGNKKDPSKDENSRSGDDFDGMVAGYIKDGTLKAHRDFKLSTTTGDLDSRFSEALEGLQIDVSGELVIKTSLSELLKAPRAVWLEFASRWLERCFINGFYDWTLHGKVLTILIEYLNHIIGAFIGLLGRPQDEPDILPVPDLRNCVDSEQTFDVIGDWLSHSSIQVASSDMMHDLDSHRALGRDFPSHSFLPHLFTLSEELLRRSRGIDLTRAHFIRRAQLASASAAVKSAGEEHEQELQGLHETAQRQQHSHTHVHSTPASSSASKRRPSVDASFFSRSPTPTKRRRLSITDLTSEDSPPPSNATETPADFSPPLMSRSISSASLSERTSPLITASMLRALTKDMRTKFSSPLGKS
ncbi:hypothetical protein CONPUDRAFT_128686 [Coniophora puteana RWD-64-598 SS2]|uniref:SAC3/GANP/THP3 conserved domain-containing protein n=1 Tax=Coniophora puteana (strain RWD-64-598) TaxID=741705 RepID=A0A5M3MFG6_CONPW|nr:uncharacterized protein CONPUDRAFT_128686 [Coniophora puteana RWD-64-598 SS2]EIW77736.1 hypothetical protein CONPUDRAFT_128686 [Coniophora puteana RWD-64-598 SS2]